MKSLKLTLAICIALTFIACGGDDDDDDASPFRPDPAGHPGDTDAQNKKIEDIQKTIDDLTDEWTQIKKDLDAGIMPDIESLKTSVNALLGDLETISDKLDQLTTLINAKKPITPVRDPRQEPPPRNGEPIGRIVYESVGATLIEIFAIDSDGKNRTNLSRHASNNSKPAWSPDGNQIAFLSDRGQGGIFIMDADGGNQRLFVNNGGGSPKWSPQGGSVIFTTSGDKMHIGGNIKPTFLAKGMQPTWSALGQIAFVRYNGSDGQEDIYVMDAHGRDPVRITDTPRDESHPAWSPDGQFIAYTSSIVQDWKSNFDIFAMNADGTNRTNITQHPGDDRAPTWSPDGRQIAFMSDRDETFNWEIYVMNADGSNQRNITNDATRNDMYPNWSPR